MLLIGAKIQEYRKKQGLSQEEFAAKVGVTRQAVSKWETDKAYPDLDKLVAICDILQISITGLVYGENVSILEETAGKESEMKGAVAGKAPEIQEIIAGKAPEIQEVSAGKVTEVQEISAGKAREKGVYLRLWMMFALIGGMFLFCGALLAAVLAHNAWKKEDALAERMRVERVYQQYTKADVSFFDDVSRRVVKTVWLDVNGIREGDFLICYTDEEQKDVYCEYRGASLIVLATVELTFFVLFLICVAEFRRLAGENQWHILSDKRKRMRSVPTGETKENRQS